MYDKFLTKLLLSTCVYRAHKLYGEVSHFDHAQKLDATEYTAKVYCQSFIDTLLHQGYSVTIERAGEKPVRFQREK